MNERNGYRLIPGTTPAKDQATRNGMPASRPYVYRGDAGRPLHGHRCPVCRGKVRPCAVIKDMAVCLGRCRTLVELT